MNKSRFFLGFVLGAAVAGTATAVLYNNKSRIKARFLRMRIRAEIEERAAKLKDFTSSAYEDIVEDTIEKYRDTKALSRADLELFMTELKRNWKEAKQRVRAAARKETEKDQATEEDDEDED